MPVEQHEPMGGIIDALGVSHTPRPGDLVAGAVVLLKIVDADGGVSMRHAWSDGMSWIERMGMYRVALSLEEAELAQINLATRHEDDDE